MRTETTGFWVGTHLASAVGGGVLIVLLGLASGFLITDTAARERALEQRVADLAKVCEVLGRRQWLSRHASMGGLQGWAYDEAREHLAADVLKQMQVEGPLVRSVIRACASRFYA